MMIAVMRMDKYLIMRCMTLLLTGLLVKIQADFEHYCTVDDYRSRSRAVTYCGRQLSEMVYARCDGRVNVGRKKRSTSKASSIFLGKDDANSLLRVKRDMEVGIVCECCVNRCSKTELFQYCAPDQARRRRSVKSIFTGGAAEPVSPFTEEIVNEIYEKIEENKDSQTIRLTLEEHLKIDIIEENKRENILAKSHKLNTGSDSEPEIVKMTLLPSISHTRSLVTSHNFKSDPDTAKLISKSFSEKHNHRHHKNPKRKHRKS